MDVSYISLVRSSTVALRHTAGQNAAAQDGQGRRQCLACTIWHCWQCGEVIVLLLCRQLLLEDLDHDIESVV